MDGAPSDYFCLKYYERPLFRIPRCARKPEELPKTFYGKIHFSATVHGVAMNVLYRYKLKPEVPVSYRMTKKGLILGTVVCLALSTINFVRTVEREGLLEDRQSAFRTTAKASPPFHDQDRSLSNEETHSEGNRTYSTHPHNANAYANAENANISDVPSTSVTPLTVGLPPQRSSAEQQNEQHCWRHCPQRINKIYFEHGSAGLGDKHTIIHMLAQMAGYLCAELEMPPPSISLNPVHNDGKQISRKVQWQDFRNMTFIQDNSPVISLNPSFGHDFEDWRKVPVYDDDKYTYSDDWLRVVSAGGADLVKDYKGLQALSWLQKKIISIRRLASFGRYIRTYIYRTCLMPCYQNQGNKSKRHQNINRKCDHC